VREEFERRNWRLPKLVIEPGRWLAARAGVAVYSIGACKKAADGSFVVAVDGGMADNPRPALYQAKYTCVVAEKPGMAMSQRARVVGKYCESGDELISETWLPDVEHGEHLVIPVAGAYQLSMASNYNMSTRPAVLWLEQGKVEVLQRREHPYESGWWMGD
jgi:diaminopimelate decarboxylase